MDPFAAHLSQAKEGDFIKDASPLKRSLGIVLQVNSHTGMMQVKFPKTGKLNWVMWKNHGHYIVV